MSLSTTIATITLNQYEEQGTGFIYGHNLSNSYSKINITYNVLLCLQVTSGPCAYRELPDGNGQIPDSFSSDQAEEWMTEGYIEPLGEGIFIGL